ANNYFNAANAYWYSGNTTLAKEYLTHALDLAPNFCKGLIKIGRKIQGMSEIFFRKCGVTGIPIGIGCIKIIIGSRLGTDGGAIKLSCCAVVMLLQHR